MTSTDSKQSFIDIECSEESSSEESTIDLSPPAEEKKPRTLKRKAKAPPASPPPAKKAKSSKPSQTPAAKHWCFTWNNPPGDDQMVYDIVKDWNTTYLVFQSEVGESGTPHIQGYAEFEKPMRLTSIRKLPLAGMFSWQESSRTGKPIIIIK